MPFVSREDMNEVLDDGVKAAIHFLQQSREFFPFGVVKARQEAKAQHVYAWDGENGRPKSDELIDKLRMHFKESAARREVVCCAIISDVRFEDTATGLVSDAIRAEIEHRAGGSIICFLPYRIANSQVETGEVVAQQGYAIVFA
jgi:hypothetical protein